MALVDDLLADGTVIPDPINDEKVVFMVPIKIKKIAVNGGGFNIFAEGLGWTETVDGQPNPVSVYAYCIEKVQDWVRNEFEGIMKHNAKEQAEAAAAAQVAALL